MNHNKEIANLHRQLADKLDIIANLEETISIKQRLLENSQELEGISKAQVNGLAAEVDKLSGENQHLRLIAQELHAEKERKSELLLDVELVLTGYQHQDFIDVEVALHQAKNNIIPADYQTEDEYIEEVAYADNLITLAEEVKILKEKYFNGEGEETLDVSD